MQISRRQAYLAVISGFVVMTLGSSAFAQGNTSIGTWKLNLTKSTFSPVRRRRARRSRSRRLDSA